ncbi:two-component system alkaline phosphatase synthesis response regulator PhoP [Mobilisporobacter senegalensis]|uniref:Stage 0 sporulation protein A homolog n=1 Tax=Mobilisporobacter senegalensis TaxID=1329262 RepID=A0A3N1XJP6_9FIRM|nr:response regulator transcription factor [Mobilisporobacter senegalensis]ROR26318.1 two-component system alkaline phosphatase synthesis response regulator PhoP [Mobilisporobacter senegalensis]
MSVKTILVLDDEVHILELINYNLSNEGYKVITAETGEEALELLEKNEIDLAILDIMLPGIDGIEVLRNIRSHRNYKKLPVILLTAKSDEISKVVGLEVGADDYLAKPFGVLELLARIRAVLRRTEGPLSSKSEEKEEKITIDHITINKIRRTVQVNDADIELSLKEFELLYLLAENRGIVFSRDTLLEKIWGYDYLGETRTVDVHIRNLRKKIEEDDNNPIYIKTVRGVGYKFS